MKVLDFWEITPYELSISVRVYSSKAKRDQEEKITMAYLTALWGRTKKMPDIKKLLGGEQKPKEQTPEDMWSKMKELNAKFGGTTY